MAYLPCWSWTPIPTWIWTPILWIHCTYRFSSHCVNLDSDSNLDPDLESLLNPFLGWISVLRLGSQSMFANVNKQKFCKNVSDHYFSFPIHRILMTSLHSNQTRLPQLHLVRCIQGSSTRALSTRNAPYQLHQHFPDHPYTVIRLHHRSQTRLHYFTSW